jgi:pilus assembly protein CpaB
MKSKTVILMVVAIGCGLAASYLTSRMLAEREQTDIEKVNVLVARRNISMGTLIREPEKFFEEKQFTKGEEPKKAIRNLEELKDRRLNKPLAAEQFVTADDLWDKDKDGISGQMPKGMRAVGLSVNAERMVGGFVLPHSHVDIVSVITNQNGETNSRIILQNILVLAVDQTNVRDSDKPAMVASTVTVQVTPEQANRLALAQKLGTISLILRPFGDDEKVVTNAATSKGVLTSNDAGPDDLLVESESPRPRAPSWAPRVADVPAPPPAAEPKPDEPKPAEPKPAEPPPPKVHTLTIYNGQSVTKAVFTLGDKEQDTSTRIEKSQPEAEAAPKARPQLTAPKKP